LNISGGTVSADTGTAVIFYNGNMTVSGDAVVSSAGAKTIEKSLCTLNIIGGATVKNTSGRMAVYNYTGDLFLGGNPTITGSITKADYPSSTYVSLIPGGEDIFAPSAGKVYTLDFESVSGHTIVVKDGAGFLGYFALSPEASAVAQLIESGVDIVMEYKPSVTNTGGAHTVTYAGAAFDLSSLAGLFTVDANAGARTYTIEAGGTGLGSVGADNKTLTVTRAGTFTIALKTAETGTHQAGAKVTATLTVNKGAAPAAPAGLGKTDATTYGGSDGMILGLMASTDYEYKKDSGGYTAVTSNASGEITGLAAGSYVVRVPGTDLYNAGIDSAAVVINQPPNTNGSSDGGSGAGGLPTGDGENEQPGSETGPESVAGPGTEPGSEPGSGSEPEPWVNPFEDVSSSDWFYGDVEYVYASGLMLGTSVDQMLFSPNENTTRGMIVTMLYRVAGSPDVSNLTNPFGDVAGDEWFTAAVIWAAANGIVSGYGNGEYGPEDSITRQDLVVILNNYAEFAGIELPSTYEYTGFDDDVDIAGYAKCAVESFFMAGIIEGKPGNIFDPMGNATRAEVAALLHRFLDVIGSESG